MTTHGDPDIHELKRLLVERLESVMAHILTDVKAGGMGSYLEGHALGRKFKVYTRGNKRGLIVDTADVHSREPDRPGRNLFNLSMHALADGTARGGAEAVMKLLGIPRSGTTAPKDPAEERRRSEEAARDRERRERQDAEDRERRRHRAYEIWQHAQPMTSETSGWQYLDGRCCLVASDYLRTGPCWHKEAQREFSALIASVVDPISGQFRGIHRTFLDQSDGAWRKAAIDPVKKTLGDTWGGVIALVRGSGRGELLIGEGIEDTLTASLMLPGRAAWTALDIGNLAAVRLPQEFRSVTLVRQRDGDNEAVRLAREKVIAAWRAEDRGVQFLDPPRGYKDINDWMQARRRGLDHAA
jgi:hypothetical protein